MAPLHQIPAKKNNKPVSFPKEDRFFYVLILLFCSDLFPEWRQCEMRDLKILLSERNADDRQAHQKSDKEVLDCKLQAG